MVAESARENATARFLGSLSRFLAVALIETPIWPERANRSVGDSLNRGAHSDGRSLRYRRQEIGSGALNPYDRQFGPAERHSAFPSPPCSPPRVSIRVVSSLSRPRNRGRTR